MAYHPQPVVPISYGVDMLQCPAHPIGIHPTVAECVAIDAYFMKLKTAHALNPLLVTVEELINWTSYCYSVQEDTS